MVLQICECVVGAGWEFGGGGDCSREIVTLGVCDFLLLVWILLVGVGNFPRSGGEVLSGVVGRGGGGSVDGSSGIIVANKEPILVGVGDVCGSGGEVVSGVVGRGGGGSVDGSSGIVVANKEPWVGGGVMDYAVVVSGGGGGVGSGGSGGRSSGSILWQCLCFALCTLCMTGYVER